MAVDSSNPASDTQNAKYCLEFPPGAQPDIIRANQKDVYYQAILQEQFSGVCQQFLGSRWQHQWQKEISILSDFCYHGLTTLSGTQTLGEEYCDLVQVSRFSQTFPSFMRRAGLVFAHTILPYIYTRGVMEFKQRARIQLHQLEDSTTPQTVRRRKKLIATAHSILPNVLKFFMKIVKPTHLAIFYFFGAYYSFSKRISGIRYIFTRQLGPHEQRIGYEVLGVLITIQIMIQIYMSASKRLTHKEQEQEIATNKEGADNKDDSVESDFSFMDAFDQGAAKKEMTYEEQQTLKCALCLEPRNITTTTPCGHLFCWNCVVEWCQNKPECPLCRSSVSTCHLIPLSNY